MYLFEVSLAFVERKHSLMEEAKEEVKGMRYCTGCWKEVDRSRGTKGMF